MTPRFFTLEVGISILPRIFTGNLSLRQVCCLSAPNIMNSVLSGLSFNMLLSIQDWTAERHSCNSVIDDEKLCGVRPRYI
jgi:hypothetical protein